MNVHYSSASDNWATPQDFYNKVETRFGGFHLDAAASAKNAKCPQYLTEALTPDVWGHKGERIWLNPPYGRVIGSFMAKAVEAYQNGRTVVCLVPARTDTRWWHEYVIPYAKVEFIRGRLKFGDAKNSAPFPSALVIYEQEGCA